MSKHRFVIEALEGASHCSYVSGCEYGVWMQLDCMIRLPRDVACMMTDAVCLNENWHPKTFWEFLDSTVSLKTPQLTPCKTGSNAPIMQYNVPVLKLAAQF